MLLESNNKAHILSANVLKLIAVITMAVDHIGFSWITALLNSGTLDPATYSRWYSIYRVTRDIGRTAFPIFAFFLVEGFFLTHSKLKYGLRLFAFALVSELPFDLVFWGRIYWQHQNVYFTLGIGLLTIWGMEWVRQYLEEHGHVQIIIGLQLMILAAGAASAWALHTDYNYKGILLIGIFYFTYYMPRIYGCVMGYVAFLWEAWCFPAFLVLMLYNGQRGKQWKYFFYVFYPLHLLVFYLIKVMVLKL